MPNPNNYKDKDSFMKACIPIVIKEGTAKDSSQAAAICHSMWRRKGKKSNMETENEVKEFSFSAPMYSYEVEDESYKETNNGEKPKKYTRRAVAIVGDRFYKGQFLPASELERVYKQWEGTMHDINHQGTTHIQGLTATSDILYFIGYNKNVTYDEKTKSVSMDIVHNENTMYGKAWKAYVDLVEEAGQTPNVSVHFNAKVKRVKAKDLPVNYTEYGLEADDYIDYIYDVSPRALSTVFRGACSDADGCGIGKSNTENTGSCNDELDVQEENIDEEMEKERQALIEWLEKHKEE